VDSKAKAYILYTSGSTGRPKGVVHTHRSALAFVQWATDHLGLEAEDVLSQHASPSFDLTVFDFFCSAMAAASLVSIPEWMFGQVPKTCRFIAETGITVWYSVPSALLRGGGLTSLRGLSSSALRHVIFAGEVIPKKAINEFVRHLPSGCAVSNWYGPTETNVCTFHKLEATDLDLGMPVPIGIPCPYVQIRLCSKAKEETETSGGELLVASETLMEGYWKIEQLTAKVCTEEHDGQRYYKTGDVVSYDRGRLQFLGRKDRMLKVRGYRVQPEEIEQVLQAHANVSEAAAVIIRDEGIDKLAAAVVVTSNLRDAVLADLERHCAEMLPRYMVPSTIILVESLPRGSRGKVDFEALSKLITLQPFPQQD
jgi:acyl-coenzyme A synthetase/AMP-(fatty) acid ligase